MSGKLYWRIKKDGKWTWKPAVVDFTAGTVVCVYKLKEEEEE